MLTCSRCCWWTLSGVAYCSWSLDSGHWSSLELTVLTVYSSFFKSAYSVHTMQGKNFEEIYKTFEAHTIQEINQGQIYMIYRVPGTSLCFKELVLQHTRKRDFLVQLQRCEWSSAYIAASGLWLVYREALWWVQISLNASLWSKPIGWSKFNATCQFKSKPTALKVNITWSVCRVSRTATVRGGSSGEHRESQALWMISCCSSNKMIVPKLGNLCEAR